MSLSYSNIKTFKAIRGIREALIDITLDGSYANGGWEITAAAVKSYSGIASIIYDLNPPVSRGGYSFEWDQVNGKLKALQGGVADHFYEAALAEYTAYPAGTFTEQAAGLAKVYDLSAAAYLPLSTCSSGAGYTANYQLFPDSPAAGDFVIFGGAVPFAQIGLDMSATVAVYDAAGVVGWDYWNGSAWSDLDASIIIDGTGSTGTTGDYFGEQDGVMTFVPPQDWAASAIDSQTAYWIKASIETGKGANMTTVGLTNSTEHDLNVLTTGYVPSRDGLVSSIFINDLSGTEHSTADIKGIFVNYTTGDSSGEWTFKQDVQNGVCPLPHGVYVNIADKCGIVITQEDGTAEVSGATIQMNYSLAEAAASDGNLNGLVLRCHVVGS